MASFSTAVTCTVTIGSVSPFSEEQPAAVNSSATAAKATTAWQQPDDAESLRFHPADNVFSNNTMGLEVSCQSLHVGEGHAIAGLAIVIRIASLRQRILRVHDFQHRGFSRLIPQCS